MAIRRDIAYWNISFFDDRRAVILSEERSPTNPQASNWFVREFVYDQAIRDTAGRVLHQFPPYSGQPKWHGVFPGGVAYVGHQYRDGNQQFGRQVIKTTFQWTDPDAHWLRQSIRHKSLLEKCNSSKFGAISLLSSTE